MREIIKLAMIAGAGAVVLVACNGGGSSSSTPPITSPLLSCWPNVPANPSTAQLTNFGHSLKIYGGCNSNESAMALVQQMTVALSVYDATKSAYSSACSATPIKSTANGDGTYTTWILTAAHCFQTGTKESDALVTAANFPLIKLPDNGANISVFSGATPFANSSTPVATIQSIYVPADYCYQYPFILDPQAQTYGCGHYEDSSHDIALLKATGKTPLNIVVQLANQYPAENAYVSQSGYGRTTYKGDDYGSLYYNTAFYVGHGSMYATNNESDQLYTTNTFEYNGNTAYVGSTCHGDSGSGIFYYQNNQWYVFGDLAALRTNHCGQIESYGVVNDINEGVSIYTDVVKFKPWLESIMATGKCTVNCVESSVN